MSATHISLVELFGESVKNASADEVEKMKSVIRKLMVAVESANLEGVRFGDMVTYDFDGNLILDAQKQLDREDPVALKVKEEEVKSNRRFSAVREGQPLPVEIKDVSSSIVNKAVRREAIGNECAWKSLGNIAAQHGHKFSITEGTNVFVTRYEDEVVTTKTRGAGARVMLARLCKKGVLSDSDRVPGGSGDPKMVSEIYKKIGVKRLDAAKIEEFLAFGVELHLSGDPLHRLDRDAVLRTRLEEFINRSGYVNNETRDKSIRNANYSDTAARNHCLSQLVGHVEYVPSSNMSIDKAKELTMKSFNSCKRVDDPDPTPVAKYMEIGCSTDPCVPSSVRLDDVASLTKALRDGECVVFRAPAFGQVKLSLKAGVQAFDTYQEMLRQSTRDKGLEVTCVPCVWQKPHELHMLFLAAPSDRPTDAKYPVFNGGGSDQITAEGNRSVFVAVANLYGTDITSGVLKHTGTALTSAFAKLTMNGCCTSSLGDAERAQEPLSVDDDLASAIDELL